jgi:hypothetical protein
MRFAIDGTPTMTSQAAKQETYAGPSALSTSSKGPRQPASRSLAPSERSKILRVLAELVGLRHRSGQIEEALEAANSWLAIAASMELDAEATEQFAICAGLVANRDFAKGRRAEGLARMEEIRARTVSEICGCMRDR